MVVVNITKDEKQRVIQEYVPGKQITLAHLIANPQKPIYKKLGIGKTDESMGEAIGIMTITPSEAAVIAADVALKAACVNLEFIDRFSGALFITGEFAGVEAALKEVLHVLCNKMNFASVEITKS